MTVKVYIPRNSDGTEKNFNYDYERNAALQVAKIISRFFGDSRKDYFLLFNLVEPPADLVVISNDGIGIVDFKNINSPIEGDENSTWYIINDDGSKTEIENNHINPAKQVGKYSRQIKRILVDRAQTNSILPKGMQGENFHTQSALLFTAEEFSTESLKIGSSYSRWLSLRWLDTIADWVYSLSFFRKRSRQQLSLSTKQIEYIIEDIFEGSVWQEIDGFISGAKPYAYLYLLENGRPQIRIELNQERVKIGRSKKCEISLEPLGISKQHAQITHYPTKTVLEDLGSSNGTYLNGKKLEQSKQYELSTGDIIVLGKPSDSQAASDSSILKYKEITDVITSDTKYLG